MLKNPDFLIVPFQVVMDKKLRPTDGLVYGVIYWLENLRDGKCTASDKTIGGVCQVGAGTVANGLTRLEKCGYIERVRNEKGERIEIKTLVSFRRGTQMMKGVSTNDEGGQGTNDEQNNNPTTRKENNTLIVASDDGEGMRYKIFTKDGKERNVGPIEYILDCFKVVNPSFARLFAQKPQRASVERMLEQYGVEKLQKMVAYLAKSNASPYAPTITTPTQLERDMGKLVAWAAKEKNKGNGKGKQFVV